MFTDTYHHNPQKSIRLARLTLRTPALMARYLERQTQWRADATAELARRMKVDPATDLRPSLTAAVGFAAFDTAMTSWVDGDGAEELNTLLDKAFRIVFADTVSFFPGRRGRRDLVTTGSARCTRGMRETRTCLILNRLHEYPFLDELPDQWLDLLADLGQPVEYPAGHRIFFEGDRAEHFWLIGDGALSPSTFHERRPRGCRPSRPLQAGSALGWSWMFPPYRWHFGAVVPARTTKGIPFPRQGCPADVPREPGRRHELMQRFAGMTLQRLQATRLRLATR